MSERQHTYTTVTTRSDRTTRPNSLIWSQNEEENNRTNRLQSIYCIRKQSYNTNRHNDAFFLDPEEIEIDK